MGIKNFTDDTSVRHTIGNTDYDFYPLRWKTTMRLKKMARPLSRTFASLFGDRDKDTQKVFRNFKDVNGETQGDETHLEAISKDLAILRDEQRASAFEDLAHHLFDEANSQVLCMIIMDSLRDLYTYNKDREPDKTLICDDEASHMRDEIDIQTAVQFFVGVVKANQKVFGDAGEKMVQAMKERAAGGGLDLSPETLTQTDGNN